MNCKRLHTIAHKGKRFRFKNGRLPEGIPLNGIYILFEAGELGHEDDRIVRVGINRENENLEQRLKDHFISTNHNSSIFIKHMGRCFINKDKNPNNYLQIWNDGGERDFTYEKHIKEQISNNIRSNFSFVVVEDDSKVHRSTLENRIISTVNHCNSCFGSESWLGQYDPSKYKKIKNSGLWQVNELEGEQLENDDFLFVEENLIRGL